MVLSDDWVPPFSELQPLSTYGLWLRERDWANLTTVLSRLSLDEVNQLHDTAVAVYEQLFVNPVATALHVTLSRLVAKP